MFITIPKDGSEAYDIILEYAYSKRKSVRQLCADGFPVCYMTLWLWKKNKIKPSINSWGKILDYIEAQN